ncbi:FadR/GntR family transcriptional regulator [Nonomuraea rhodomycinica]|uniref:FadR family transcriptional regulator n=1 Tax=Nonomuraea rhodomycinica TaxID=1712872 RepID=A0A7Y6M9X8_9ACTN|nr:FadR/GntR family transcriptional regulator [Nonomuraea rhodomycinica]NUW39076.1 FadR family transcriptional regulator [Nonomuraea rhodomycinica]
MTSRTQRLVDTLTARIREGVVRPGERLPTESSLVETYGVSRTVVREAISRLQAAGLVETHHGRGTFVLARPSTTRFPAGPQGEVTLEEVTGLLEFRTAFEVEAAALAARRRTDAHLADLREALDAFAGAAEHPSTAVNADYRFHLRVALATGNHHFADLISSLGPSMIVVPRERLDPGGRFAGIVAEHEHIYAAIARGDADAARAAARVHLANSRARLLQPEPGDG